MSKLITVFLLDEGEEGPTPEQLEHAQRQRHLISLQKCYIKKHFGREAVENANYGWGMTDEGIATKVYGHGVLDTDNEGNHQFYPF